MGSTTLRHKDKQAGKEPDDCYCIETDKDIPDLAIEVIYSLRVQQFAQVGEPAQRNCFTSGGVETLKIYQHLDVNEVWFWQNQQLTIYCLQNDSYQQQQQSKLLPDLDLGLLSQYVIIQDPLEAVVEWRKQIKSDKPAV